MARIRTIKPEFWTSEQVADCSPTARLLFIGMWNFCDDNGVHPASAKRIKMEVFPGDNMSTEDIDGWIAELKRKKLLVEFEHNGQRFWHIPTFKTHQKIEKPNYKHPSPPKDVPADEPAESATAPPPFADQSPTDRHGNGKESNGVESNGEENTAVAVVANRDASCPYNFIGQQFVAAFGGTVHVTDKRRKAMSARWRDEFWRENWQHALDKASGTAFFRGDNDRNWKITFDFFLRPDSVVRIIEGNYDGFTNSNNRRNLTAAEQREQLNARSFQWIRDSAAQADAASGASRGLLSSSTGEALLLEEHGTANTSRG